jgi:lysozyme
MGRLSKETMDVRELIEKHEGRRNKPYKCPAGKMTIGVGYNFDDNPLPSDIAAYLKKNGEITEDMIDRLLFISVGVAAFDCYKLFPDFNNFSENRQAALTDWMFNLGYPKASKFYNAITAINAGNWQLAATHLSRSLWYEQVPNRAEEICKMIEEG